MDPVTTAGIIAAGASIAAQGANAVSQGKMNRRGEKNMWRMYAQQRQDALADQERLNQYNSPTQQMRRLKEAGLNPHLIYGGAGNVSQAAPAQQADVKIPNLQAPTFEGIGNAVVSGVSTYLDTQVKQAQIKQIDANTLKTLQEIDTSKFDLHFKEQMRDANAQIIENILKKGSQDILQSGQRHTAEMENLDMRTRQLFQEVSQQNQRHEYDLLQRAQNLQKGTQEIINLRIDAVNKRLETELKNGEITRQYYEKETNRLDQMMKHAQRLAIQKAADFKEPNDALDWVNSILGFGAKFIK